MAIPERQYQEWQYQKRQYNTIENGNTIEYNGNILMK